MLWNNNLGTVTTSRMQIIGNDPKNKTKIQNIDYPVFLPCIFSLKLLPPPLILLKIFFFEM